MLGGAIAVGASRHGDRPAVIDERGSITYHELDQRSNALANAWRALGLEPGQGVAILARNKHRRESGADAKRMDESKAK